MSDPQQPHTTVIQPSGGVVSVASDTVGALKSTPVLLVMVLLNLAFIGAGAYYLRIQQDNITRLVDKMLDSCLPNNGRRSELEITPSDYSPPKRPYTPVPNTAGDYRPSALGEL